MIEHAPLYGDPANRCQRCGESWPCEVTRLRADLGVVEEMRALARAITTKTRIARDDPDFGPCVLIGHATHRRWGQLANRVLGWAFAYEDDGDPAVQPLQDAIAHWSRATFGRDTPLPALKHLRREVDELIESPSDITEYADCLMLVLDAAHIAGISADQLVAAAWAKLEINRGRTWGAPNAEGFSEHIEDGDA